MVKICVSAKEIGGNAGDIFSLVCKVGLRYQTWVRAVSQILSPFLLSPARNREIGHGASGSRGK